jgi:hypothetical protein
LPAALISDQMSTPIVMQHVVLAQHALDAPHEYCVMSLESVILDEPEPFGLLRLNRLVLLNLLR